MLNAIKTSQFDILLPTFFGVPALTRFHHDALIRLTDRSYLPKPDDLRSDWVASVAVPAFKAIAESGMETGSFCTIGTGSGMDALAAIELLNCRVVGITDLHPDVVAEAEQNIRRNMKPGVDVQIIAGVGDLLAPIAHLQPMFDVIYENLPNIPQPQDVQMHDGQISSTFVASRQEAIPEVATRNLVWLHHLALQQSYSMLREGGKLLSSIGARIPLSEIVQLSAASGYQGKILVYCWKIQSEPEEVITGYARAEADGYGPFHFYPVGVLEQAFAGLSAQEAGRRAFEIEAALEPHKVNAREAKRRSALGQRIGHTVAVLESTKVADQA